MKRTNSNTGGRFFACSRFPRCTNTREQELKNKLGDLYGEIYCPRGHHKPTVGVSINLYSGRESCQRCIEKGYVKQPIGLEKFDEDFEDEVDSPFPNRGKPSKPLVKMNIKDDIEYCRNGHIRTNESTYIRPDGSRECRTCKNNTRKQY